MQIYKVLKKQSIHPSINQSIYIAP